MKKALKYLSKLALLLTVSTICFATDIPDYYSEPGINPYRSYINQDFGESIDPFTGKLQLHYADLFLPGNGGFDIRIQRSYTSLDEELPPTLNTSIIGMGWDMAFGLMTKPKSSISCTNDTQDTNDNPVMTLADGSREVFAAPSQASSVFGGNTPAFISKNRWIAYCQDTSTGLQWTVYSPDGTRYELSKTITSSTHNIAAVRKITDTNGNSLSFEYFGDSDLYSAYNLKPFVKAITASDGRVITFDYYDSNAAPYDSMRLRTITANGQTTTYEYLQVGSTNLYRLTGVDLPGSNTGSWGYRYIINDSDLTENAEGRFSIDRVTYPYGGVIQYTYARNFFVQNDGTLSNGIATKRTYDGATLIGEWSYAYKPGYESYLPNQLDQTTVTMPGSTVVYQHIGLQSAGLNEAWKIGLLQKKLICESGITCTESGATQVENYTWDYQTVSEENFAGPRSRVDPDLRQPILVNKVVTRDGSNYQASYSDFDNYGNARRVDEFGDDNKTTLYTFYRNSANWIVNQVEDETVLDAATIDGVLVDAVIDREYSSQGNLLSEDRYGVLTKYTYYATGDVETTTNARNKTTTFKDYYRGIARREERPEGVIILRTVNGTGTLESETNGREKTTGFTYDALNRLQSIDYPINSDVSIVRTPNSRVLGRGNYRETVIYDGFGQAVSEKKEDTSLNIAITTTTQYDALGRKKFKSYPNSSTEGTSFTYDALGRTRQITHTDNSYVKHTYLSGNRVETQDELFHPTVKQSRSYGDPDSGVLVRVEAPEDVITTIGRDKLGNVTQIWQGNSAGVGSSREFIYNGKFYVKQETNPETGPTYYGRDEIGNMTSRQVGASGPLTTYVYDDLDRLELIDYPAPTPDVGYVYDKNSNLKELTNQTSKRVSTYDENDNLRQEDIIIEGALYTVKYDYDAHDYLGAITYPTGRVANYQPDALGRPTKVAPVLETVTYHPSGQPHNLTYSNGQMTEYTLTPRRWIENIQGGGADDTVNLNYGYDFAGNITSIANALAPSYSRTMQYDGLNRLDYAEGQWGIEDYAFTEIGDIKSINYGGASSRIFNYVDNKLDSFVQDADSENFSYDDYGNVDGNSSYNFFYNDAQQLELATPRSAGESFSFGYDGNNMRVVRDKEGQRKRYVYSASGLLLGEYPEEMIRGEEYFYLGTQRVATTKIHENIQASAGADKTVYEGETVTLDATGSTINGFAIDSYQWEQISGPRVILSNAYTATATFVAPRGLPDYTLQFRLKVSNYHYSISDTDTILVNVKMVDTDGDALSDYWETGYYSGLSVVDGAVDTDGDGLSAAEEFLSQTDPTTQTLPEAAERLRAVPGNSEAVITWMSAGYAKSYDLYWSNSPDVSVQTGTKIENATSPYTHAGLVNGDRYYYVVVSKNDCCETVSNVASIVPGISGWTTPSVISSTASINSGGYKDEEFKAISRVGGGDYAVESYLSVESYGQYDGWRDPVIIQTDGELDLAGPGDITMGDDGSAIAVWKQGGTLVARHYSRATGWGDQYSWTLGYSGTYLSEALHVAIHSTGEATILAVVDDPNNSTISIYAIDFDPQTKWSEAQLVYEATGTYPGISDFVVSKNGHLGIFFNEGDISQGQPWTLKLLKRDANKIWGNPIIVGVDTILNVGEATISPSGYIAAPVNLGRLGLWREDVTTGVPTITVLDDIPPDFYLMGGGYVRLSYDDAGRVTAAWSSQLSYSLDGSTGECFLHSEVANRIYYKQYSPSSGWSELKQIEVYLPPDTNCRSLQENFAIAQDPEGDVHLIVNANAGEASPGDGWATYGSKYKAVLDYELKYDEGNRYPADIYAWYKTDHMGQFGFESSFDPNPIAYSDTAGNIVAVIRENIPVWTSDHPAVSEYVHLDGSPNANAGINVEAYPQELLTLDAGQSTSAGSGLTTYAWSQLAGQAVTITGADTVNPTFTVPEVSGKETLWFELKVTDANGLSDTDSVAVTVYPSWSNLVAIAGPDVIVMEGSTVTLDGSNTQDPNGIVVKAHWLQSSLPQVQMSDPTGSQSEELQWLSEFIAPEVDEDTVLTFKLRVEDSAGRVVYAYKRVTVKNDSGSTDVTPPVVTPPADIDVEATAVLTPVVLGSASATDDVDGSIPAQADTSGPFALGSHVVTWSATDSSGNTGTATQNVVLHDSTPPSLTAPAAISVNSNVPIAVSLGQANASDIFAPVLIANDAPQLFPLGETIVTWTATDQNGNTATATQSVTVIAGDVTPPVVTPPPSVTVEATAIDTPVNLGSATAVDDTDGTLTPQPDQSGPFSLGVHTITWSATDAAGNTGTATQTVEVQDTTPPTIDPPSDVLQLSDVPIAIDIGMATADDLFMPVAIGNDAPSVFPLGQTLVTWTATDANGNTATATQLVDVREPTPANQLLYLLFELWNYLKDLFGW